MACNPCKTKLSNAYINTSKGQLKFELEFKTSKGQRLHGNFKFELGSKNKFELGFKRFKVGNFSQRLPRECMPHPSNSSIATLLDNMKGSLSCIRWIKIM